MNEPDLTMLLGPAQGSIGPGELPDLYPWPAQGGWWRGMMVQSLDGASVGGDRLSGSISSPVDRAIMAAVRRRCDAVLIGAGTFRAERYRPLRPSPEVVAERQALGLAPAPRLVVVSASLELPWEEDVFTASPVRPLVVTAEGAARPAPPAPDGAEIVRTSGDRVAVAELPDLLAARGLHRIVCEGGPHLLAQLARADVIDELDLAISPALVGGGQIPLGPPDGDPRRFLPVQVLTADGFLFVRYLARATGPAEEGSPA